MLNKPLVTVVIPVFNAGEYLYPALNSIINQTYQNLEIIIVDDGSTDGCMSTIQFLVETDHRIQIIQQPNYGKAVALNRALDVMHGDFWLIQDADDMSYPNKVEKQLDFLISNPDTAAVYVGHDLILDNTQFAPTFKSLSVAECKMAIEKFEMPAHDATGMYRVRMVNNIRFDPELRIGQGIDYVLKIGENKPIALLGECLYSYRINYNSTIRKKPQDNIDKINIVRKKACIRRNANFEDFKIKPKAEYSKIHRAKDNHVIAHCMESIICLKASKELLKAICVAFECIKMHPLDIYYYKPFFYSLSPLSIITAYRTLKK